MIPAKLKGLSVVLVLVALMSVGCSTRYKNEIDRLNNRQDVLIKAKSQAESELSKARADEQVMRAKLTLAESNLTTATGTITDLEAKVAAKATAPAPANGGGGLQGETTVYKHTVGSDVLFSSGRATLTTAGKRALATVASKIKTTYPSNTVRIYGHTDSDKIVKTKKLWADNLDLSANRAMAVTRYLIDRGVLRSKIETVGMGASRPITDNKTKAGKAKNRRVEIVVVK